MAFPSLSSALLAFSCRWLTALILAFVCCLGARATTVVPPEFDSLVQQADYVVRGTALSVRSEWREQNGHRNIVTFVEFSVSETIAGTPPSPLILQMLGGKVGDKQLIVQGAPNFSAGDEHILFVRGNGVQFNPLVALMHGQYPIKKDSAGRPVVSRSDGSPLHDEKDVSLPMESHVPAANSPRVAASQPAPAALTAAEFTARIRAARQKSTAPRP